MKLYEITNELRELLENGFNSSYMDEDGEIDEEKVNQAIEGLSLALDEKVDGIADYIQELNAMESALTDKERELKKRREGIAKKRDSLEQYLISCLYGLGKTKYETVTNKVTIRNSVAVAFVDETKIPEEYKETITTEKISKSKIMAALKLGMEVEGAYLKANQSLIIK